MSHDHHAPHRPRAPFPDPADPARFAWLTAHPVVGARERTLLAAVAPPLPGAGPFLEIGAGEGANLLHLAALWARRGEGPPPLRIGLDRALAKLRFARDAGPGTGAPAGSAGGLDTPLVAGDALRLPLLDATLGGVLLRDVLHHVDDRRQALAEAARVLAPGAPLTVLEASGEALMARVFARVFPHESGLRDSTFARVRGDLEATGGLALEQARMVEPAPFYRLAFHHRFGLARLGGWRPAVRLAGAVEWLWRAAGAHGSYLLFVARKR